MANVQGRRIAALSDMLELGENEKQYHYEVGKYIASKPVDEVVVFGTLSRELLKGAADGAGEADVRFPGEEEQDVSTMMTKKGLRLTFVKDRDAMTEYLLRILRPEDVLLLKASNGMKLSEVAKAIIG